MATSVRADYSGSMNRKYKVAKDMTVAFCETDNTNMEEVTIDLENTVELKNGDDIQLIKINTVDDLYYVQLPDGRLGVFTTQLAG